ncbi:MAG: ECF transporter S component [Oscillospiraceae bacterium]
MCNTKRLVFAGLCVALGVALPIAFHSIPNAGSIFLPMHIPVLLCGLICGPIYGLACGILAPLLSSLLTGMPPMAILPGMLCELAVYGLVTGLLIKYVHTGIKPANLYVALVGAMLAGRLTYGVLNALIFKAGAYSMQLWLGAAFVTSIPGIIAQLVFIPLIVLALERAKLVELKA